jgi:hypothetical protein
MSKLKLDAKRIGPFARAITRGSLGSTIDGRSVDGKYLRRVELELLAQLGDGPTFSQKLLVTRIARGMLALDAFDRKLAAGGSWTAVDSNTMGGLQNSVRLNLRELGIRAAPAKAKPTLAAYLAQKQIAK